MARFVCDFETVNSISERLSDTANNLVTAVDNYNTNIESSVSGWTGEAKDTFVSSNNTKTESMKQEIQMVSELADFLKKSSNAIETLDESLASMDI